MSGCRKMIGPGGRGGGCGGGGGGEMGGSKNRDHNIVP